MSITAIPADLTTAGQIVAIPVEAIRPAPDNPRGSLGDLTGLTDSIKGMGVLQPIRVTPRAAEGEPPYMIVMGHRRYAAAIRAGLATVPAVIVDMDETDRVAAMHVENMNREDLKPTEEAASLRALKALGMKERAIADLIGRTQGYVNKRLSLLALPDDVCADLDAGRLTTTDAIELATLKDDKAIRAVLRASKRPGTDSYTYEGVALRVGHRKEEAKREQKVRQLERALRAEGISVVEYPANHAWTGKARRLGTGYNEVHVEPDKHAKKPCHAAAVKPDGEVVYVCTDPARHQPKERKPAGGGGVPAAPARVADTGGTAEDIAAERARAEVEAWAEYHQREGEQERAELDAAAERRRAFIGDLVRGKPNKNDTLTLILTDYLDMFDGFSPRVLTWLGIDVPPGGDDVAAFIAYTRASLANLTRAALALLLDEAESRMPSEVGTVVFLDRNVRRLYDFLTGNGYEPSEIEQRGLRHGDAAESDEPTATDDEPGETAEGDDEPDDAADDVPADTGDSDDEPGETAEGDEPGEAVA